MSTETSAEKIIIDRENHQSFALSDERKTVVVGEKQGCNIAVAGDLNTISSSGEETRTSAIGRKLDVNINGKSSVTAITGTLIKLEIDGVDTRTSVSGDGGRINITGANSRAAICTYQATVNVSGDNLRLAICDAYLINITGDNNEIAVVGVAPLIDCIGTGNRISCSSKGALVHGKNGNWLSFADQNDDGRSTGYVTGCIGRNGLEEDFLYYAQDGEFVAFAAIKGAAK